MLELLRKPKRLQMTYSGMLKYITERWERMGCVGCVKESENIVCRDSNPHELRLDDFCCYPAETSRRWFFITRAMYCRFRAELRRKGRKFWKHRVFRRNGIPTDRRLLDIPLRLSSGPLSIPWIGSALCRKIQVWYTSISFSRTCATYLVISFWIIDRQRWISKKLFKRTLKSIFRERLTALIAWRFTWRIVR